jgi:hypothetical protein
VYKARLRSTGEQVAVKVQRPGIGDSIAVDMVLLRRLVGVVDKNVPQVCELHAACCVGGWVGRPRLGLTWSTVSGTPSLSLPRALAAHPPACPHPLCPAPISPALLSPFFPAAALPATGAACG